MIIAIIILSIYSVFITLWFLVMCVKSKQLDEKIDMMNHDTEIITKYWRDQLELHQNSRILLN